MASQNAGVGATKSRATENGADMDHLAAVESILGRPEGDDRDAPPPEPVSVDAPDLDDSDAPPRRRFPLAAVLLFLLSAVIVVVGVVMIKNNPQWQADLDCFLTGDIAKCKRYHVEQQLADWRRQDQATQPRYGDIILVYHPQDSLVTITQTGRTRKGWDGELGAPETRLIPNKSQELQAAEVVEQLPLVNLPIRERSVSDEGEILSVSVYEYTIRIEKEGYEPREFRFTMDDWQRIGPDVNYTIAWPGCDLVPKPETVKEPFRKAMAEVYCLEQYVGEHGEKLGITRERVEAKKREITIRHGFKTMKDFADFQRVLTADTAWWGPAWAAIQAEKCPPVEEAPWAP